MNGYADVKTHTECMHHRDKYHEGTSTHTRQECICKRISREKIG